VISIGHEIPEPAETSFADRGLKLHGLELVRVGLPLRDPWTTAAGAFRVRDSLLVRVVLEVLGDGEGGEQIEGWGECGALPAPSYSSEYTEEAARVSVDRLVPALAGGGVARACEVIGALSATKGHNMAKTAFEGAFLDAELQAAGRSLASYLASASRARGGQRTRVTAGVAVGLAPSLGELVEQVGGWVAQGYKRVKLKIRPGQDMEVVAAVRERWPDLVLAADANGTYAAIPFDEAVGSLRALEPFGLVCVEQPLADDDLLGHAELARRTELPISLDEALSSLSMLAAALRLGACSVANIKAGRLGGYLEAVKAHDLCNEQGVPVFCGGLVETGVARAANVALAALPNFKLPGDLSASGRFFEMDLTSTMALGPDGAIAVPEGPGLGVSVDTSAIASFATWRLWCPVGG